MFIGVKPLCIVSTGESNKPFSFMLCQSPQNKKKYVNQRALFLKTVGTLYQLKIARKKFFTIF